jgi:hypothetical protein
MQRKLRPHSAKTKLSETLDHRVKSYSIAAAAAGVSMLALAEPAQAKVVYTPANVNIKDSMPYALDVNGDGTADFTFEFTSVDHTTLLLAELDVPGNAIHSSVGSKNEAIAFPAGAPIGPAQLFTTATTYGGVFMAAAFAYSRTSFWGPWANKLNRYLGVKFLIDGEVHYGWARFSVDNWEKNGGKILLTGYAYETDVNTKIIAGDEGSDTRAAAPVTPATPASQPASLGLLARGAAALLLWRPDATSPF